MDIFSKYVDLTETDIRMLNPLVWAYVGDAVYEVFVRSYLISTERKNSHDLHVKSIKYVKARSQSEFLALIEPELTEEEQNIVRRGRNTKTYHVPKNADVIDYRRATAFEALIGYLYLMKRYDRIDTIMQLILNKAAQ
ncbi:Mini-ribonuclease 3 [Fervidicella metallireducens]